MQIRLILCLITAMLLIVTVQAAKYRESAGPWTYRKHCPVYFDCIREPLASGMRKN